jgi:hypothetical protein
MRISAEPDPASRSRRRRHQLADRLKNGFELRVVLRLESSELLGQVSAAPENLSKPHERMISMFTCTARGLRSTLESIATPCSVNALGRVRVPPQLDLPEWNIKLRSSSWVSCSHRRGK